MSKKSASAKRKRHSPSEKAKILAEASAQGLTGAQVSKRYGIATVTYYLWRKQAGKGRVVKPRPKRRGRRVGGLSGDLRAAVQARVRELLPGIVDAEVAAFLKKQLG